MMFSLAELIVFSVVIVIIALLIIGNVRSYLTNKNLVNTLVQAELDKMALESAFDKLANEYEIISMQETDGFVKFLSESRDSAFTYIEEVQSSVKALAEAMALSDDVKIARAYANLIKHMPKEEVND